MKALLTSLLVLLGGLTVSAQVDLEVRLVNVASGAPIGGGNVLVENVAIGLRVEKTTDEQGKATFFGLPVSGSYDVVFPETADYNEASERRVTLQSNTNASVVLPVFGRSQFVSAEAVITATSKINLRNAEVASQLKQKEIEALPLEGRDMTRLLYRLPNVVQATGFYPEAPNVSINGANPLFTSYLIDGMDNNEQFLGGMKFNIPVGFAKNINVLTNNFSTEYGLTANGVVNVTSRSGSNETSGEVFMVTRPGGLFDAQSQYAQRDLSGNLVKEGFQRYQTGFSIGGPIVKDKTFYYVNAEYSRDLKDNVLFSPSLDVNQVLRGENNFSYLSGKVDHHWSSKFTSSLRANLGIVNIERQGGGLDGGVTFPSAGNFQDRNSLLAASQNTYLGSNFKSETRLQYSRFRWNYGRAVNPNSPQVTVLDPSGLTIAVLGHPGYLFDSHESTVQAQQKLTYYADKHTIKAGVEFMSADHFLYGGGNPNGNYRVQLTEDQMTALRNRKLGDTLDINDISTSATVLSYTTELRPASFGARHNMFSAYLEDAFSATSRLNITAGLRYDYDNLSKGGGTRGDFNNIAPRISFNYKLNNQSSIRGGYGIFYDKILYAVYSDALQQNTTDADYKRQLQSLIDQGYLPADADLNLVTFDGNLGATADNVAYLQGPSSESLQGQRASVFSNERRILNPNGYQNPYTHQVSLGYQKQLNNEQLFYADAMYNRSENLFRLANVNPSASYSGDVGSPAWSQTAADLTRPVAIHAGSYALIDGDTVRGVARNIMMSETAGMSRYAALSLNFQKDLGDDNYSYRVTYTLSRLINDTEDINFRAMNANQYGPERAPSINDRTHVINGMMTYYPSRRLAITMAALLQSGQPINRIPDAALHGGTTDLNGDGFSFSDSYVGGSDRHPTESRNSDRLPWANTFDMAAQYSLFSPESGGRAILRLDIFNLFNAANLSGYSNNATQSNQIQVGSRQSGVLVRRNASPPRQTQISLRWIF